MAFPGYFSGTVEDRRAYQVVRLAGELDLASAEDLEELLTSLPGRTVVVELSGLAFIDASGIAALFRARRHLRERERSMVIKGPLQPPVYRAFQVLGASGGIVKANPLRRRQPSWNHWRIRPAPSGDDCSHDRPRVPPTNGRAEHPPGR